MFRYPRIGRRVECVHLKCVKLIFSPIYNRTHGNRYHTHMSRLKLRYVRWGIYSTDGWETGAMVSAAFVCGKWAALLEICVFSLSLSLSLSLSKIHTWANNKAQLWTISLTGQCKQFHLSLKVYMLEPKKANWQQLQSTYCSVDFDIPSSLLLLSENVTIGKWRVLVPNISAPLKWNPGNYLLKWAI